MINTGPVSLDKFHIRKLMREQRQKLSPRQVQDYSNALLSFAKIHSSLFESKKAVLTYFAIQSELDPLPLVSWLRTQLGLSIYYPRLDHQKLDFRLVNQEKTELIQAPMIFQPQDSAPPLLTQPADCLVLVPGIAFSADGQRVGFGKGYYDQFLTSEHLSLGLAYDFQISRRPEWTVAEHDVAVRAVLSPSGLWTSSLSL